jgi:hypothetical protein
MNQSLLDAVWQRVELNTLLPEPEADFLALKGPESLCFGSQRRFHRFYFRGKAILERQENFLGVYTKDISRQGISFLSPVELSVNERVQLRAIGALRLELTITRCRLIGERCFDCGATFVRSR